MNFLFCLPEVDLAIGIVQHKIAVEFVDAAVVRFDTFADDLNAALQ